MVIAVKTPKRQGTLVHPALLFKQIQATNDANKTLLESEVRSIFMTLF